jgi:hypothetical protein
MPLGSRHLLGVAAGRLDRALQLLAGLELDLLLVQRFSPFADPQGVVARRQLGEAELAAVVGAERSTKLVAGGALQADVALAQGPAGPAEPYRLERIRAAAGTMTVVNAADEDQALAEIAQADALFGTITPRLLAAAGRLRWVQAPTASLEHYLFPELVPPA